MIKYKIPETHHRLLSPSDRSRLVRRIHLGKHKARSEPTESLDELRAQRLEWIGLRDSSQHVAAALAFAEVGGVVDIDRLVVAPDSFRLGYARALVGALPADRTIVVSTGKDNHPAHALYQSLGFAKTQDQEVVPGLVITHFRREAAE